MIDITLYHNDWNRENAMIWLVNHISKWPDYESKLWTDCLYNDWYFIATHDRVVFANGIARSITADDAANFLEGYRKLVEEVYC